MQWYGKGCLCVVVLFLCFVFCLCLCPVVCWWVYVFFFLSFFWGGSRGLGWVVPLKIPWSIYLMLFRVANLSALLLPYFTVMLFFFASPWQWEPTGVSVFFFFSYFSAGLFGNDVHSLASSFILAFSHFLALFFNQHKYLLVPAAMTSQHLLCHLYKALLYVHDIELVEIGVWWTMSVCFFFPPHQT